MAVHSRRSTPQLQVPLVARPRNQHYLHEVVIAWRPLISPTSKRRQRRTVLCTCAALSIAARLSSLLRGKSCRKCGNTREVYNSSVPPVPVAVKRRTALCRALGRTGEWRLTSVLQPTAAMHRDPPRLKRGGSVRINAQCLVICTKALPAAPTGGLLPALAESKRSCRVRIPRSPP